MNLLIAAALGFAFGAAANDPTQGPTIEDRKDLREQVTVAARDLGYLSALGSNGCGYYDQDTGSDFLTHVSQTYADGDSEVGPFEAGSYVGSVFIEGVIEAATLINQVGCDRVNGAVVELRYTTPFVHDALSLYTPKGY